MNAERVTYLDSSAIVKLAVVEAESAALRAYLRRRRPLVSSALARTEGAMLSRLVTYDERMAQAARTLGWMVVAPS